MLCIFSSPWGRVPVTWRTSASLAEAGRSSGFAKGQPHDCLKMPENPFRGTYPHREQPAGMPEANTQPVTAFSTLFRAGGALFVLPSCIHPSLLLPPPLSGGTWRLSGGTVPTLPGRKWPKRGAFATRGVIPCAWSEPGLSAPSCSPSLPSRRGGFGPDSARPGLFWLG